MVKKLVIILSVLLTLLLLSCAAVIYVDSLRNPLLALALQSSGVSRIDTKLRDFSRDHIGLEFLNLRVVQAERVLDIELKGVRLALLPGKKVGEPSDWKDLKSWGVAAEHVELAIRESNSTNLHETADSAALNLAELLPKQLLSQVPLGHIDAADLMLEYSPLKGDSWLIKGNLRASGQAVTSKFDLTHAGDQFAGELALTEQQIALTIGDQQRPWVDVQTKVELLDRQLVLGGAFQLADLTDANHWLSLLVPELPQTQGWVGHLKGAFSGSAPESTIQAWMAGQFSQLDKIRLQTQIEGDVSFNINRDDLQALSFRGSASIQLQQNNLIAKLLPGSEGQMRWATKLDQVNKIVEPLVGETAQIVTHVKGQGSLSTQLDKDLQPTDIVIDFTETALRYGKQKDKLPSNIRLKNLNAILSKGILHQVRSEASFDVHLPNKPKATGHGKLHVTSENDLLVGTLAMTVDGLAEFVTDFDYQLKRQKLSFIVSRQKATLATSTFNEWAEELGLPFNLDVGDIELKIEGSLNLQNFGKDQQHAMQTKGSVVVSGWEGQLEKNRFSGLDSPFDFSGDLSQVSVTGQVSNGLFDIGIPVTETRYHLELSADLNTGRYQVRVIDFESKLLGGMIRIPELTWDSEQTETKFNVVVYNWKFSKLIDVLQRDDLKVTGVLDGMFPVTVRKGEGVEIHDGLFTARKPGGVIKYRPDTAMKAYLSDQEQLKMAVDILENYHYTQLDVLLNQQTNGEQLLTLTLKGKNPKAYGGSQVNLNLNVEHNINPLLQTLTLPTQIQENWQNLESLQ
ncbi:MAG: YdbH domain-containing protein [Pseudomonadales bacterium]|nr:YdbH domain-containing protein [Pseudomonadales bacterium]